MNVSVWGTYAPLLDDSVWHFNIIVPIYVNDSITIHGYGKDYLMGKGVIMVHLGRDECRFCHVEEATEEMIGDIKQRGCFIQDIGIIPEKLPENSSRKELIFHLKAHYQHLRFADMKDRSEEELLKLMKQLQTN